MKLDKSCIGKKMKRESSGLIFTPLAITSRGTFVGEGWNGEGDYILGDYTDWQPYQEPKTPVRIETGPAVLRLANNKPFITATHYESFADVSICNPNNILIQWPAPFDPVRGVWYFEE